VRLVNLYCSKTLNPNTFTVNNSGEICSILVFDVSLRRDFQQTSHIDYMEILWQEQ
jgi:hypothetical protein